MKIYLVRTSCYGEIKNLYIGENEELAKKVYFENRWGTLAEIQTQTN